MFSLKIDIFQIDDIQKILKMAFRAVEFDGKLDINHGWTITEGFILIQLVLSNFTSLITEEILDTILSHFFNFYN